MNHYEILEVSPRASKEVIRAAYKSLIQRYHPDKNPGDASVAERASRVVQAYEVLSDADKRAAYDLALRQTAAAPPATVAGEARRRPAVFAGDDSATSSDNKLFWYLCALIGLILVSGWLTISFLNRKQTSAQREQPAAALKVAPPAGDDRDEVRPLAAPRPEAAASDVGTREIPELLAGLAVSLRVPDKPFEDGVRVLHIPKLGVRVGTYDSDSALRHIRNRKDLVIQRLIEKLAYASYEELSRSDGELYLGKLILDSIGETTGTNRFEAYPSSPTEIPGRYGAIEVLLPESFAIR